MNHDAPWWCSLMADAPPPALPRSITKGPKLGPRDESTSTSWREATNQHHDNVAVRRFPSCARFTESRVVAVPISSLFGWQDSPGKKPGLSLPSELRNSARGTHARWWPLVSARGDCCSRVPPQGKCSRKMSLLSERPCRDGIGVDGWIG